MPEMRGEKEKMKCPKDVMARDFKEMLKNAPKKATLLRSTRVRTSLGRSCWRDFIFLLNAPHGKGKRGDFLIMQCPCKFERHA